MSLKFCACVQVHSSGLANIGNIIQDPYLLHGNGLTHFDFCGTGCELFASTGYGQIDNGSYNVPVGPLHF